MSSPAKHCARKPGSTLVLTVGHSTRPLEEFLRLLQEHQVRCLVDVRTIPRSRYNPQFNSDALEKALRGVGIGYVHLPELGGLRHAKRDSVNTGWRNASFRGFADYMQTANFEKGLDELVALAKSKFQSPKSKAQSPPSCASSVAEAMEEREASEGKKSKAQARKSHSVAIMCAEAVPWRCHRSLIADALLVRGIEVEHIMSAQRRQPHALTPFAKVRGARVTYPESEGEGRRECESVRA